MANMKYCECCGREFFKRPSDSYDKWESRLYCSISCVNKSRPPTPIHIRFWVYVDKTDDNECWLWTGSKDALGYGRISRGADKSPQKAHRLSWEIHNGELSSDLVIRHKCDNPSCVNPFHLLPGTQKENMQDASDRNRLNPVSLLNLRPGTKGIHGAGPLSNREL